MTLHPLLHPPRDDHQRGPPPQFTWARGVQEHGHVRTTKADNEPSPEQDTVEAPTPAPTAVAEAAAEVPPSSSGEPYPGAGYFHGGRHSDIVAALGRRLEQEGCAPVGQRLGPDWTNAHRRAFAAWQHKLRPKEGGDVSGVPDEVAWDKLRVPRVSPLPKGD